MGCGTSQTAWDSTRPVRVAITTLTGEGTSPGATHQGGQWPQRLLRWEGGWEPPLMAMSGEARSPPGGREPPPGDL